MVQLTSLRKKSGIDGMESLLGDQTRRTLGLEAPIDTLHFGDTEPETDIRQIRWNLNKISIMGLSFVNGSIDLVTFGISLLDSQG